MTSAKEYLKAQPFARRAAAKSLAWALYLLVGFIAICVVASVGAAIDSPRTCTTTDTVVGLYGTSTTVCK